jgi:heme oxygenase
VKQNLGYDESHAARYLNMHGPQTNPRFQLFRDWLDSLGLSATETQQAIRTAIQTFQAVGEWHRDVERLSAARRG